MWACHLHMKLKEKVDSLQLDQELNLHVTEVVGGHV